MSQIDREKAMDALNGAKEKSKAALSEIKANFKADEGAEGIKKYQSMFKNLWRSGTTGKAVLIAGSAVILLLSWLAVFGRESEVAKLKRLTHEMTEVQVELCELDDLLGRKPNECWSAGRSLEQNEVSEDELKGFQECMAPKDRAAHLKEFEDMINDLKAKVSEKKAECKKKGIEVGGGSPLRVAKEFILCMLAKDTKGMKKLLRGDEAIKENIVKGFLESLDSKQGQAIMGRLKNLGVLGPTIFNDARNLAGVPLDDEGESCLRLVKTEDGWLVAGRKSRPETPVCSKRRIIENAD